MAEKTLSKTDPILIVGAGVFGLSTALHLGQRGYTNITVLDKQPYDETLYSYDKGCDAASAGGVLFTLSQIRTHIQNQISIRFCDVRTEQIPYTRILTLQHEMYSWHGTPSSQRQKPTLHMA